MLKYTFSNAEKGLQHIFTNIYVTPTFDNVLFIVREPRVIFSYNSFNTALYNQNSRATNEHKFCKLSVWQRQKLDKLRI